MNYMKWLHCDFVYFIAESCTLNDAVLPAPKLFYQDDDEDNIVDPAHVTRTILDNDNECMRTHSDQTTKNNRQL